MIYAALYGIKHKLELPKASDINLYKADAKTLKSYDKLPENLEEACKIASASDFVQEHIPRAILEIYVAN